MTLNHSRLMRYLSIVIVLLPLLGFGIVLIFQQGYLFRRDENILLAILQMLQKDPLNNQLETMVFDPVVLAFYQSLAPSMPLLLLGRLTALVSGLICALLMLPLARYFAPSQPFTPLIALACLLSSSIFVIESSFFRFNLPSLALSLAGIVLLLKLPRPWQPSFRTILQLGAAGILFGLAMQLKPLMLVVAPLIAGLLYLISTPSSQRLPRWSYLVMIICILGGSWLLPSLLTPLFFGSQGSQTFNQLGAHVGTAGRVELSLRINHSFTIMSAFFQDHIWMTLLACGLLVLTWSLRTQMPFQPTRMAILALWLCSTAAILFVNFPTWDHHFVYLLPPLAIAAAMFLHYCGELLLREWASISHHLPNGRVVMLLFSFALAFSGTFQAFAEVQNEQPTSDVAVVESLIEQRTEPHEIVWSDNLLFPLLTHRSGDLFLLDLSVKRILAGKLTETQVFEHLHAQPPQAVIRYDGLWDAFPRFITCLEAASDVTDISLNNQRIYWLKPERLTIAECAP